MKKRTATSTKRKPSAPGLRKRVKPPSFNPLFALKSGTLATLDEIESGALAEIDGDVFMCGEHEDLINIIPSLCRDLRAWAEKARNV